ncbi:hypothetical protein BDA96_03G164200 [Sorghum bicolor]|jgi:hypothetical protein|uniref:Uncharacterized protein n=2 Tax=Sorghum bicolor TaxID=4558 RepID=A0A921REB5_SORBI|nr:hypothetical protein BDA96_03G164200 [Sorghum bicolor]OQU86816.1 hypothetical protein SORBI_3003G155350 [Sorghum bicolor]
MPTNKYIKRRSGTKSGRGRRDRGRRARERAKGRRWLMSRKRTHHILCQPQQLPLRLAKKCACISSGLDYIEVKIDIFVRIVACLLTGDPEHHLESSKKQRKSLLLAWLWVLLSLP